MRLCFRTVAIAAVAALASSPLAVRAAEPPPVYSPETQTAFGKIIAAAKVSDYAYQQDEFLSDAIGPRLSGSENADAGVKYVAAKLRGLGLDVRLEPVTVSHWVRGEETGELTDWPGKMSPTHQKIVLTALGMSVATPDAGITAPVAVVNNLDELKALGPSVRGKIVLFNVKWDKRLTLAGDGGDAYGEIVGYRYAGPAAASKLGAVAMLLRSAGSADYRLPHTGGTGYAKGIEPIPAAAITAEDAELISRLSKNGSVSMHLMLTPKMLPDVRTANVIADLKGTEDPNQIVIISGHLDSWDLGTGATDDGAGVAQAMGVMAVLHDLGLRPRRTIRCIAWMNEENGVAGGKAYAVDEKVHVADTVAAIETDSGAEYPLGFGTSLSRAAEPFLAPLGEALAVNSSPLVSYSAGSETDIGPIVALGVPAYAPIQNSPKYFDYHHTAADTIDKIDPAGMAANTAVLATLAFGLADALRLPPREVPLPQ